MRADENEAAIERAEAKRPELANQTPRPFQSLGALYYMCYNIATGIRSTHMAARVKIRKVGNSLGVILTKDVVESLGVAEGDELFAIRTPEGIRLTPYDPDFATAIESTREYMRRHRDALHELAKR
jgi:putative addiction module antidote